MHAHRPLALQLLVPFPQLECSTILICLIFGGGFATEIIVGNIVFKKKGKWIVDSRKWLVESG